jgi:hypothetical protein
MNIHQVHQEFCAFDLKSWREKEMKVLLLIVQKNDWCCVTWPLTGLFIADV